VSALPEESQPTLDDVARVAGVSKATVSKVASGRGVVLDHTRQRIEAAARHLGYRWRRTQPHLIPRGYARTRIFDVAAERLDRRTAPPRKQPQAELGLVDARASEIIFSMNAQERHQYQMENVLPIVDQVGWSLADEDYDTRPVPPGCAGCWRKDLGAVCCECPSRAAEMEQLKAARKRTPGWQQGLAFAR
jgi:transcriptional regulator with XRE-family HTH domain